MVLNRCRQTRAEIKLVRHWSAVSSLVCILHYHECGINILLAHCNLAIVSTVQLK